MRLKNRFGLNSGRLPVALRCRSQVVPERAATRRFFFARPSSDSRRAKTPPRPSGSHGGRKLKGSVRLPHLEGTSSPTVRILALCDYNSEYELAESLRSRGSSEHKVRWFHRQIAYTAVPVLPRSSQNNFRKRVYSWAKAAGDAGQTPAPTARLAGEEFSPWLASGHAGSFIFRARRRTGHRSGRVSPPDLRRHAIPSARGLRPAATQTPRDR